MSSRSPRPHSARLLFSTLACATLLASALAPMLEAEQPRIERLTAEDGLVRTQINDLLQDRLGFLWIATIEGLHRYSGRETTTWRQTREQRTLPSNDVRVLYEDSDGILWIGGYTGGLARCDPRTESFEVFPLQVNDPDLETRRGPPNGSISAILQDPRGFLWIGTYGDGLFQFDPHAKIFLPIELANHASNINDLLLEEDGSLWVATSRGLVHLAADGREEILRFDPENTNGLPADDIQALARHPDGRLILGTVAGLAFYDPTEDIFFSLRSDSYFHSHASTAGAALRINALLVETSLVETPPVEEEKPRRTLWVGTDGGLLQFDLGTDREIGHYRHEFLVPQSLSDDRVTTLITDRSGLLWVGTRVGLNQLNPLSAQFQHLAPDRLQPSKGLLGHRVRSLLETRDGDLWVGTRQGLSRFEQKTGNVTQWTQDPDLAVEKADLPKESTGLGHPDVTALYEDRSGTLWIGTPWSGLSRFDQETGFFRHFRHDPGNPKSLASDDILAITEGPEGNLWIGTYGGLSRLDFATETFRNYYHHPEDPDSLGDQQIFALYFATGGVLWIGTEMAGLERFDPATETFQHFPFGGVSAARIHAILGGVEGEDDPFLWVATWGGGLDRLDPRDGSVRVFTEQDGLASNSLYGLLADDMGHLWLSSTMGISRFHIADETFRNYTVADGLPSNEFSLHAYARGRERFYFGGINGVVAFDPKRISDPLRSPKTVLTSARIRGLPIDLGISPPYLRTLDLSHEDDFLSFDFAALDYTAPAMNHYRYILSAPGQTPPDDPESWIDLANHNELTFSDLAPGEHTLRIQGSNHYGLWDDEGIHLTLHVRPAWWETWWFRIAAAFGLIGGITLFFERRARRLRKEIAQRRKTEEERELLIGELEEKNAELERFNYTVSHDLKSPLVTIRGFLGHLERDAVAGRIERMRGDMARIENAVDTMQNLLDELLRLSRAGHQPEPFRPVDLDAIAAEAAEYARGRRPNLDIDMAPLPVVPGDYIRLLEVFQNLLDNAAKFLGDQEAPRIEVGVRARDERQVTIYIRDNGLGIDPQYHEKIFGLFDRVETEIEGTGIGLALVKRIVEMHGGKIWVESKGLGHGSTFLFSLRLQEDPR